MICQKCGYNNDNDNIFCMSCGTKLIKPVGGVKCPNCGRTNDKDNAFCMGCGKPLTSNATIHTSVSVDSVACPKCGYINDKDNYFCMSCGEKLPNASTKRFDGMNIIATKENIPSLLQRVDSFLADQDWVAADYYCERILDFESENAKAYLGKLMSELKVTEQEKLKDQAEPFDDSKNYKKVMQYADNDLKEKLMGYISFINERNEKKRLEKLYQKAVKAMNSAASANDYRNVKKQFQQITEYKDSAEQAKQCDEKALELLYNYALKKMNRANSETDYKCAKSKFEAVIDYKDSRKKIMECEQKAKEYSEKEKEKAYQKAMAIMNWDALSGLSDDEINDIIGIFSSIIDYKDSKEQMERMQRLQQKKNEKSAMLFTLVIVIVIIGSFIFINSV